MRGWAGSFPEAWAELEAASGRRPGQPLLEAYLERLTDPDPAVRHAAALAWCTWEDAHVAIGQLGMAIPPGHAMSEQDPEWRLQIATHVVNNWSHDAWLGESGVLDGIDAIAHIPAVLIHGRLDVSGPVETPGNCIGAGRRAGSSWSRTRGTVARSWCRSWRRRTRRCSSSPDYSSTPRIAAATALGTFSSKTLGMM